MSFACVKNGPLCALIQKDSSDTRQAVCQISNHKATAVVLFLIGAAFIATGLYLTMASVGTISSFSLGCILTVGGSTAWLLSVFACLKKD